MVSSLFTAVIAASLLALTRASSTPAATISVSTSTAVSQSTPVASSLVIQMPIDHFSSNSSNKTYSNRYWINGTYYRPGGPVFYYDPGETTVTANNVNVNLRESTGPSAVMQLAAKYHGMGVMMEHRFYGQSDPYPINPTTGIAPAGYEAYQYLTVEQALEDVVYLAENFAPPGYNASQLRPTQTPWIFIGGSYPGARAAWIRIRNPDVIYASWASSAPVQTTIDMATYYEQVSQDMTKNCSSDLAAASQFLTTQLTSGSAANQAAIKILLALAMNPSIIPSFAGKSDSQIINYAESSLPINDFSLTSFVRSFIGSAFQSYGFSVALGPYCDALESFDVNTVDTSSISSLIRTIFADGDDSPAKAGGIAQTVNQQGGQDGGQGSFFALVYGIYQESLSTEQSSGDATVNPYSRSDAYSWQYQSCTDFGYFMVSNTSSPNNFLSAFVNVSSWEYDYCTSVFKWPQLPSAPNVNVVDARYGGWNMNPSQVMFTDGLKDPWHTLSTQSTSVEIGAPNRTTIQDVPACGKSPDSNKVFGLLYPDQYHVSDLRGTRQSFHDGLALFEKALDVWLSCFQQHSISSNTTSGATPAASTVPSGSASGSATGSSSSSTATSTSGATEVAASRNHLLGSAAALASAALLLWTS